MPKTDKKHIPNQVEDVPDDELEDQKTELQPQERPVEYGGQAGPEPTRYGDWEKKGRCTDF